MVWWQVVRGVLERLFLNASPLAVAQMARTLFLLFLCFVVLNGNSNIVKICQLAAQIGVINVKFVLGKIRLIGIDFVPLPKKTVTL